MSVEPHERLARLPDESLMAIVVKHPGETQGHAAFEEIVRRYQRRAMAFVLTYLTDREEAADIVQETFLTLYSSADRYRREAKLRTYIFSIARNLVLTQRARKAREPVPLSTLPASRREAARLQGISNSSTGLDKVTDQKERASRCAQALRRLPERQRELVTLRLHQGLRFREIARMTGESEGTLRSRYHHAVRRLKQFLHGK